MPRHCRLFPLLLVLATLAVPRAAAAQADRVEQRTSAATRGSDDWSGQAAVLGMNALVNGLAAGLVQELRGRSFQDGFTRGALGGAVTYAGKRVAVEEFAGAGLLGRQLAAVGGSVTREAAEGLPMLSRLVLPAGPVRVYLARGGRARLRVDLHTLAWTAYAAAVPELRLDAGQSLSSGAPVFVAHGYRLGWDELGQEVLGFAPAGVILLADGRVREGREVVQHERVHVLQYDQLQAALNAPLQQWLAPRVPGGKWLSRYVDLDVSSPVFYGLVVLAGPSTSRPWEREAYFLAGP